MKNSNSEENYLKAIFYLTYKASKGASTSDLAKRLKTQASSVTDMIKKLAEKGLLKYKKYQGVILTAKGKGIAIEIIRKHRLWEVFLVEKLSFKWDEVHDIAEQLEHIHSKELVQRLDQFLEFPGFDPHGDPIPDEKGYIRERPESILLLDLGQGESGIIIGVRDSEDRFLRFLEKQMLLLGTKVNVIEHFDYDDSVQLKVNDVEKTVSKKVARNIIVEKYV